MSGFGGGIGPHKYSLLDICIVQSYRTPHEGLIQNLKILLQKHVAFLQATSLELITSHAKIKTTPIASGALVVDSILGHIQGMQAIDIERSGIDHQPTDSSHTTGMPC